MSLKTSNKNRKKVETLYTIKELTMEDVEVYKEVEEGYRQKALDEMSRNAQELGLDYDKPTSGVEGFVTNDAFPHADLTPTHLKWITIGVGVAIVALLII